MKKGLLITFIGNALLFLLSFINGYLIILNIGSAGKGEIAFLLSIHQIVLPIVSLGLKQSLSYFEKKYRLTKKVSSSYKNLATLLSLTSTAIFYLVAWFSTQINPILYILLFLNTFGNYLLSFSSINAIKKENFFLINAIRLSPAIVTFLGFLFLTYFYEWSIINTLTVYSLSTLISIFIYNYSSKELKSINLFKIQYDKRVKILLWKGIQYATPLFLLYLIYKVDIVLLKLLSVSNSQIGYYSLAVNFAEILLQLPSILSVGIFTLGISRNKEDFKLTIDKMIKKSLIILLPLMILFERVLVYLIPIVYGEEFNQSTAILKYLIIGSLAMVFYTIKYTHLASTYGKPNAGIYPLILALSLNIIFNLLLIPELGITGAAISTCIAYSILYILISRKYSKYVN